MTTHVTVHSTPNCQQCKATKRVLIRNNISYTEEMITPTLAAELKQRGLTTAPYVTVHRNGKLVDEWSGFRTERLGYLVKDMRDQ